MNSYEMTVAFGWIIILIGFFGALLSNYDFATSIYLLPIFLFIILCGMIVWYYAVKGREDEPAKTWSDPQTLQEIIGMVTVGNIVLWAIIWLLKIIILNEDIGDLWFFALLFFAFLLFMYVIFSMFYIIIGLKIKKVNEKKKELNGV
ncbi:MAG: hypothetical protein LBU81_05920 [Methanosarcinales archaeon]|jgi:hypothetical protein|nr:hypothetical protein [Methanosarcinales archaeon]